MRPTTGTRGSLAPLANLERAFAVYDLTELLAKVRARQIAKLERRIRYGGKKGRSAKRRLRRLLVNISRRTAVQAP